VPSFPTPRVTHPTSAALQKPSELKLPPVSKSHVAVEPRNPDGEELTVDAAFSELQAGEDSKSHCPILNVVNDRDSKVFQSKRPRPPISSVLYLIVSIIARERLCYTMVLDIPLGQASGGIVNVLLTCATGSASASYVGSI
jgi:hypothetical protein